MIIGRMPSRWQLLCDVVDTDGYYMVLPMPSAQITIYAFHEVLLLYPALIVLATWLATVANVVHHLEVIRCDIDHNVGSSTLSSTAGSVPTDYLLQHPSSYIHTRSYVTHLCHRNSPLGLLNLLS